MPYGYTGVPPALPALPGFAGGAPLSGGTPLFGGAPSAGNLNAPGNAPAVNPFQTDVNGSASIAAGSPTDPCATAGQAAAGDPCAGMDSGCSFTNMSPCINAFSCRLQNSFQSGITSALGLATCRIEQGAKSAGIYLAAAGIGIVGIYLLIRK